MRSPEPAFTNAINSYYQTLFWMVHMAVSSGYYYTDCDVSLVMSGQTYQSRRMEISPAMYSLSMAVDQASVVLDNVDGGVAAYIEGSEIRGCTASIRQAAVTSEASVYATEVVFTGRLDSAEYNEEQATIKVYNQLIYWTRRVPRRQYSPACQVPYFTGSHCTYAGSATFCDRSYTMCATYSNTAHFKGHRWLSAIEGKRIYWGRPSPV